MNAWFVPGAQIRVDAVDKSWQKERGRKWMTCVW